MNIFNMLKVHSMIIEMNSLRFKPRTKGEDVAAEPTKNGKDIEEYLSEVNMEPWYYIYDNFTRNDSKE